LEQSPIYLALQDQLAEILAISNNIIKEDTLLIQDLKLDDIDIAELGLALEELYNLDLDETLTMDMLMSLGTFLNFVLWIEKKIPTQPPEKISNEGVF
jgi:acyl carrier protein